LKKQNEQNKNSSTAKSFTQRSMPINKVPTHIVNIAKHPKSQKHIQIEFYGKES